MPKSDAAVVGMALLLPGISDRELFWERIANGADPLGDPGQPTAPDATDEATLGQRIAALAWQDASTRQTRPAETSLIRRVFMAQKKSAGRPAGTGAVDSVEEAAVSEYASSLLALVAGLRSLQRKECDVAIIAAADGGGCAAGVVLKRGVDAENNEDRSHGILKGFSPGFDAIITQTGRQPESIGYWEMSAAATDDAMRGQLKRMHALTKRLPHQALHYPLGNSYADFSSIRQSLALVTLIKVLLVLAKSILPPCRDQEFFDTLAGFKPLYGLHRPQPWIQDIRHAPRRAVLSFPNQASKSVRHFLIEHPADDRSSLSVSEPACRRDSQLLVLSAPNRESLAQKTVQLQKMSAAEPQRLANGLLARRWLSLFDGADRCRLAIAWEENQKLENILENLPRQILDPDFPPSLPEGVYYGNDCLAKKGKTAVLFPGLGFPGLQGPYLEHLQQLCLHFPPVREVFDRIDRLDTKSPQPIPVGHIFFPPESYSEKVRKEFRQRFDAARFSTDLQHQAMNLASFGVAVANWVSWTLLRHLKIPVDMLFGQSVGELTALCASGIIDFEEFIHVYWQIPEQTAHPLKEDRLAVVNLDEHELQKYLGAFPSLSIAIHFRPHMQILGGDARQLVSLQESLKKNGIWSHRLPYPAVHTNFFSRHRPLLEPLLKNVAFQKPRIPVYSATTCDLYPTERDAVKRTMIDNLDHPVRLWQTYRKMADAGARLFIQAGGGATMHEQVKVICAPTEVVSVAMDVDYRSPVAQLNRLCAMMLTNGGMPDLHFLMTGVHADPLPPSALAPSITSAADDEPAAAKSEIAAGDQQPMPFIGPIIRFVAGREIKVERTLTLKRDLFLNDHLFVKADGLKPPSSCFPVLPMTMGMEAMAEVAACLAPGLGLIGFEHVKAKRWVAFNRTDKLKLGITARFMGENPPTRSRMIKAELCTENDLSPAMTATVIFGPHYLQSIEPDFHPATNPRSCPLKADTIYRERRLFHGPSFQCISGEMTQTDQGLMAEMTVLPPAELFAARAIPPLLFDPVILDGAGQLVGLWAQLVNRYVLPVSIGKLEFYRPPPPVGTRVPVELQVIEHDSKTIRTDMEVQDGVGNVWMRVKEWTDWSFRWTKKVYNFRRFPTRHVISHDQGLLHLPEDAVCQTITKNDLRDFELGLDLAAAFYLHDDEMGEYQPLRQNPERQFSWLLGRIAAKEAVRLWLVGKRIETEMLHPASVIIEYDERHRPLVRLTNGSMPIPHISISHSRDRAVAIACAKETGIDLEWVCPKDDQVLSTFASGVEIEKLRQRQSGNPDLETIRLWSAKEALGKALGCGLAGNPHGIELERYLSDQELVLRRSPDGLGCHVFSEQHDGFIVCYAFL